MSEFIRRARDEGLISEGMIIGIDGYRGEGRMEECGSSLNN